MSYSENKREYMRRYYKEHREKILEDTRQYRKENADKISEYKRQYYRDNAEQLAAQSRRYSKANRLEVAAYQRARDIAFRTMLQSIKLFYGCSNPHCVGPWLPDKLHFHHVDPATKLFNVTSQYRAMENVILEVNKCMVLCRWCHVAHHKHGLDVSAFRRCIVDANGNPL